MAYIGIDIAGGSIKSVLFSQENPASGRPDTFRQSHHFGSGTVEEFLSEVYTHIDSFLTRLSENRPLRAIGLASPGPLSPERDKILSGIQLKLEILVGVNLREKLSQRYGVPVFWERGANLFTLAESTLGAARGHSSVFGISIGAGLGGGFTQQAEGAAHPGKTYLIRQGAFGSFGEVGHTVIKADGEECWCGQRGCLEQYASEEYLRVFRSGLTIEELHRRVNLNYDWAKQALEDMGYYTGKGVANVINVLNPSCVVLGGELLEQHSEMFLSAMEKAMRPDIFSNEVTDGTQVFKGELGYYATAIGAMIYAHQQVEEEAPRAEQAVLS